MTTLFLDTLPAAARDELVSEWLFEEAGLQVKASRSSLQKRASRAFKTISKIRNLLNPEVLSDLKFFYNRVKPGTPFVDVNSLQNIQFTVLSDRKIDAISIADVETQAKVILFKYYYGSITDASGLFRDTINHIFNGTMMEFNAKIAHDLCVEKNMPKLANLVKKLPVKLQLFRQFYKELAEYDAVSRISDAV